MDLADHSVDAGFHDGVAEYLKEMAGSCSIFAL
jgi:hypothetical protein